MIEKTPHRRKVRGPAVFFTLAMIATAFALALIPNHWHVFVTDPDRLQLDLERSSRLTWYRSGITLSGTPDYANLDQRLKQANLSLGSPIFIRIFKREFKLELWMKHQNKFQLFTTYPICRYSGWLGPKLKQGDRQAPEGVYTVSKDQLNPASRWHRSFNLGFPNRFDRDHGRTGNYLMVHGGCSSAGCYAMTNDGITELWKIVTTALNNGQKRFQVQVFPFQMTKEALENQKDHRWLSFWQQLKPAYDIFETTRLPPRVKVCKRRYFFEKSKENTNGSAPIASSCKGVNSS